MHAPVPVIDVIIPVYNAPELTKRCVDSVITRLGPAIRTVLIHDDASDADTRAMLAGLAHPQIIVYHAPMNQGYGRSVNQAVSRSDADWVLVLNSDIEILYPCLSWLCAAMDADPALAVISPIEDNVSDGKLGRYLRCPGGYIATYRFRGYAFLMRRAVFVSLGGFDAQFGRGYYEDTDLGRRLDHQGWRMGVHPDAKVRHTTGASFGRGKDYHELVRRNRALYFSRYPLARQNVLAVSGAYPSTGLPVAITDAFVQVMRQGGRLHWLTATGSPRLLCLQMRHKVIRFGALMALAMRGWLRADKRITVIWLLPGVSRSTRVWLKLLARVYRLPLREW
ncbi:MAG: glycosyltransferase family 2 protein [Nitrosomonas sp.]|nr:MAG: glycosyltransferase family 2 protein [Nitrosomonas sp.]